MSIACSGQNKSKILRAIWVLGIKKLKALKLFSVPDSSFSKSNIFYTSGIEMSQHFQLPFGPLVFIIFFGPHQILRAMQSAVVQE